ncbi:MAG: hypothetical protein M3160_07470 [Candidatus Eremiobacteraeota bacterium]|nr:hypothetical protein [Candidatus Eremiobacteraeota bacterium]
MLNLSDAFVSAVDALSTRGEFAQVEIVDRSARRIGRGVALLLVVDSAQGVDVALCERIATHINERLEEFEQPYTLEVESAGLERPLRKAGDFQRFCGKEAKVLTTLLINGSKTHRGRLWGVRGTNVILETPGGELPLPLATIRCANLEYDFRADLKREKQERKYKNGAPSK